MPGGGPAAGDRARHRCLGRRPPGRGPVCLPHRPRGADQRAQARGTGPGRGRGPLPSRIGDGRGERRRPGRLGHRTPGRGGHGLLGMRERVAVFGGELAPGAGGGGFRVAAIERPLATARRRAPSSSPTTRPWCGPVSGCWWTRRPTWPSSGRRPTAPRRWTSVAAAGRGADGRSHAQGHDGLDATRAIFATAGVRVIMLTTFDPDEYVFAALQAGASGFLLKDADRRPAGAVRVVAGGDALLSPPSPAG